MIICRFRVTTGLLLSCWSALCNGNVCSLTRERPQRVTQVFEVSEDIINEVCYVQIRLLIVAPLHSLFKLS